MSSALLKALTGGPVGYYAKVQADSDDEEAQPKPSAGMTHDTQCHSPVWADSFFLLSYTQYQE